MAAKFWEEITCNGEWALAESTMHDKIGLHVLTQCLREIEGDAYGPMRSLIRSRAEKSR
jgi:hypothetical protein